MTQTTPIDKDAALAMVKDFLTRRFEVEEEKVTPSARFYEDLGLDSIDALDILGIIESELKVKVDTTEARDIRTVADAAEFIVQMNARQAKSVHHG
ncbi:MAG: hypothetical protein JW751_04665 [Polyangiaceae bacterium]|nr:hypothetical protein [Polyangiaceae bacterium]